MTNHNQNYWKKRFEQLEELLYKKSTEVYNENQTNFEVAEKEIDEQIAIWYQRFADNNEISMSVAKKWLDSKELKELKWDLEEYIKYGRENALNKKWIKELENASAKYHISRLESLKIRVRNTLEQLYQSESNLLTTHLEDIYTNGFYRTCFEVQKGYGIGFDVGKIDLNKLKKILSNPWSTDNKNFSDRIWDSKAKLITELNNELTTMCLLGKAPDEAIKNISKNFNVSKAQAGRLVMTESAFISSVSRKECFGKLGIEKYEIIATLDDKTSETCQSLDGEIFDIKDYEPGVTAPPFHPNCRTTTAPTFDDEYDVGERAAKDNNDKTYYIPSNMKYNEWKNKYVIDEEKSNDKNQKYEDLTEQLKSMKGNPNPIERRLDYSIDSEGNKHYDFYFEKDISEEINYQKKLEKITGYEVYLNPKTHSDGYKNPDFWVKNTKELWDLKGIDGNSKNIIDNILNVACKKMQTPNLILKQRKTSYEIDYLKDKLQDIFEKNQRLKIKQVILFDREDNVIVYYKR